MPQVTVSVFRRVSGSISSQPSDSPRCRLLAQGCRRWALQQVGSSLGYTGHQINVIVTAAGAPMRSVRSRLTPDVGGQQCCSTDPSKPLCRGTSTPRNFCSSRAISDRGRAYNEAPAGTGRKPMPSTSVSVGRLRSSTGSASQITHQRHKSPSERAWDVQSRFCERIACCS